MASASELNTAAALVNGHGLAVSANLLTQISTFQNHTPITLISTIYGTASAAANNAPLMASLDNVGSGVTHAQWVIDFYPSNVTPVSSGTVYKYGTGSSTSSVSHTLTIQAQLPFSYGMSGFANVYLTAYSWASGVFDTISSVNLLKNRTYAQAGLGYSSPLDLATNGINAVGPLLSNVVSGWGTMYDINNISTFSNPYVFGQNLLNQGLGSYGNLSGQFTAAGLNTDNLSQVPQSTVTVSQVESTESISTPVGVIELPVVANSVSTTSVTGTSPEVLMAIYSSITGANLQAIVLATGITSGSGITSLADYLNYQKVVDAASKTQLSKLSISDFSSLSAYMQSKVGQGLFKSWKDLGNVLVSLEVPTLSHTSTTSTTGVLSAATISTITNITGTGAGAFDNPVIADYLGASSGIPYTPELMTLNYGYSQVSVTGVNSTLTTLQSAVDTWIQQEIEYSAYLAAYAAYLVDAGAYDPLGGGSPPVAPAVVLPPDIGPVDSAVSAVNSALNAMPSNIATNNAQSAYYRILNRLAVEVSNCAKAGVTFTTSPISPLNFGLGLPRQASDKTQYQTYQYFANLITPDVYGDTIRSAIAEVINTKLLSTKGIVNRNDPDPAGMIYQAQLQNLPLSTYISRNK